MLVTSKTFKIITVLFALFALGFALVSENFFAFHPCKLCTYHRWLYVLLIFLTILALYICRLEPVILGMILLSLLSLFQVGVEHHLVEFNSSCSSDLGELKGLSAEQFYTLISSKDVTACDVPQYLILKISFAEATALVNMLWLIISFVVYFNDKKTKSKNKRNN